MAYLIDMEEEEAEVPSTLLRSVCQTNMDQTSENINADNLLINVRMRINFVPTKTVKSQARKFNSIFRNCRKFWLICERT
jgi:hypothetical protein